MTNWMTAAGIAFIAGGLATLISLRSVLFGGGKGREGGPAAAELESATPPARRSAAPASTRAAAPEKRVARKRVPERRALDRGAAERRPAGKRAVDARAVEPAAVEERRRSAGRPRAEVVDLAETAYLDRVPADDEPGAGPDNFMDYRHGIETDDEAGGLASIGLAADDDRDLGDELGYADEPIEHVAALVEDALVDDGLVEEGLVDDRLAPGGLVEGGLGEGGLGEGGLGEDGLVPSALIDGSLVNGVLSEDALAEDVLMVDAPAGDARMDGAMVQDAVRLAEPAAPEDSRHPSAAYTLIIPSHRPAPADSIVDFPASPEPVAVTPDDEESRPIPVRRVDRSDRRYGDRVAGWVRPEYHDDPTESPSGEYWTPVPMDDLGFDLAEDDPEPSAKGYGWPIPVERLPAVPDYEPATGFDLTPVASEPTEVVPIWPPDRRVRLPRSWTSRNEKPADNRFLENEAGPRRRTNHDEADQRFRTPAGEPERRRPRPRPRPGPDPDNVYVSRHAAEPPRGIG